MALGNRMALFCIIETYCLLSIYKVLAMIICVMTRAVISRVGTNPLRVFPGRKESLGGGRPKKYLKNPDLVMRKERNVMRRVRMATLIGRLRR